MPERDLLLQVFPFDHRLPALVRLMEDPEFFVGSYVLADLGPGERPRATWNAEVVRYRVDTRAMVRLTVEAPAVGNSPHGGRRIYAKVFRNDDIGQWAFQAQRALWEQATAAAAFVVARPIAYLEPTRTLLFDNVSGIGLRSILDSAEPAEPAVRLAARALASLHQLPIDTVLFTPRRRLIRDEELRLLKLKERLLIRMPHLGRQIDQVVDEIAAQLISAPGALTHFDLRPEHILIDGEQVAFLDFDKLALADPMVDVANMLALLGKEWETSRHHAGHPGVLSQVFRDEYFAHVPAARQDRLPAHYALALLARAAQLERGLQIDMQQPDQAFEIEELLRQARAILAGPQANR